MLLGEYRYAAGWNPAALIALAVPLLINLPGFLHSAAPTLFGDAIAPFRIGLHSWAWFIGKGAALTLNAALMTMWRPERLVAATS